MAEQNPHAEALQGILNHEIGRRLFSSFPVFNNAKFLTDNSLKAEVLFNMLNEKVLPDILLSEIPIKEKKKIFVKAFEVNIRTFIDAYVALAEFMVEKQSQHPTMKELREHLRPLLPSQKEKK